MPPTRRRGREIALQILCSLDANPELDGDAALRLYFHHLAPRAGDDDDRGPEPPGSEDDQAFISALVGGTTRHREEIDALLRSVSRTWRVERMARVDRNLLRLATYELQHAPEIPARVILNEAIELAKRYGTAESPAFINGLLDSALKALPPRT
jgi:N utilization substance protein B